MYEYKYVIVGSDSKALAVRSEMNFFEMEAYLRRNSFPMENGDIGFQWGIFLFSNPKLMVASDFLDSGVII